MTGRRVVIVEDTKDLATLLVYMIRHELGWEAEAITEGFETLLDPQRWVGVDIVLCDLMMPGMDGLTILEWMKQNTPGVRRVVLSAVPFFKPAVWEVADVVLQKPTSISDLRMALESV